MTIATTNRSHIVSAIINAELKFLDVTLEMKENDVTEEVEKEHPRLMKYLLEATSYSLFPIVNCLEQFGYAVNVEGDDHLVYIDDTHYFKLPKPTNVEE